MSVKSDKKIKALHLASFSGNIGDFANHQGFYKKMNEAGLYLDITELEIRKFYKNRAEMSFDESLVDLINTYDLLILGGGGFFDLRWDDSRTGTTIDFSEKIIEDIKIPVLVNAMGYHEMGEISELNVKKFDDFLRVITKKKNWFVSVRNDGTYDRLSRRYDNVVSEIMKVPDSGFFYRAKEYSQLSLKKEDAVWVGLNITNDEFSSVFNNGIDTDIFNTKLSKWVNEILKENNQYKIIFFPHTHQDVTTIGKLMEKIDDKFKRERIMVAPFLTGEDSLEQVFDLYRICACVIGMRFHTNVCCIAENIPTIGLAGHEQISSLYDELGLSDRCIKVNTIHFSDTLTMLLNKSMDEKENIKNQYKEINSQLSKQSHEYIEKVKKWMIGL